MLVKEMLRPSSHAECWEGIWRPRHSTPRDGEVQGGTVPECMVEEPQEPMLSFGGHAVGLSLVEVAAWRLRSVGQEPGHQSLMPKESYTEVQRVVGWAANDGRPRSVVQLLEEGTEAPSLAAADR